MSHSPGKLGVSRRDGVITEDGEPLLLTGVSLCLGGNDDRKLAAANTDRFVACWNACDGLTPEQVAAIPRLVAWFVDPNPEPDIDGFEELYAIFPTRAKP
jgi:hypothetical protein